MYIYIYRHTHTQPAGSVSLENSNTYPLNPFPTNVKFAFSLRSEFMVYTGACTLSFSYLIMYYGYLSKSASWDLIHSSQDQYSKPLYGLFKQRIYRHRSFQVFCSSFRYLHQTFKKPIYTHCPCLVFLFCFRMDLVILYQKFSVSSSQLPV